MRRSEVFSLPRPREAGMSIIEVFVVVVIGGMLVGLTSNMQGLRDRQQLNTDTRVVSQVIQEATRYSRAHNVDVRFVLSGKTLQVKQGSDVRFARTLTGTPTMTCRTTSPCTFVNFQAPFGVMTEDFKIVVTGKPSAGEGLVMARGPVALADVYRGTTP